MTAWRGPASAYDVVCGIKRSFDALNDIRCCRRRALRRQAVDQQRQPITLLKAGETKASPAYHVVFTPGPADEVATVKGRMTIVCDAS